MDAIHGKKVAIPYSAIVKCKTCQASGCRSGQVKECKRCNGTGRVNAKN